MRPPLPRLDPSAASGRRHRIVDFGWGLRGLQSLLPTSDVIVIVDVLSFSTAVDVATSRGAQVLPFPYGHSDAESYARSHGALLAQPRQAGGEQLSLSPETLKTVMPGTRIVLPSPNGSRLSRETGAVSTLTGCLRNAAAVAQAASALGPSIGVIAAGERWPDGSLRPAIEDLLGAGSIIECMTARPSPDAEAAQSACRALRNRMRDVIRDSQSGRELIEAGFAGDVEIAIEADASSVAPLLRDDAYVDAALDLSRA